MSILLFSLQVSAVTITQMYPADNTFNISTTIELNATITDTDGISSAHVNVTYPNATIVHVTLNSQSGNKYNASFTIPTLPGTYNLSFWANDTLDNTATNTSSFTGVFSDPTNIAGLLLWLDATDNTTLYTDASCATQVTQDYDEVLCWENKAGGTNTTVVSGKWGARYRTNASEIIGGETVLRFNKSNESVYETGIDIRANTTEDLTIFTTYRPRTTDVTDQGQAIWGNDNGAWDRFYYSLFAYNAGLGTDGVDDGLISLGGASSGLAIDGAGIVDTVFLLTAIYDGNVSGGTNVGPTNASQIYFDGNLQVAFTDESHATAAQTQMYVGRDGDNGHYDGDVAEIIVFNRTLDACELEIVNKHLSEKYGKDFFNITSNYGYSSPHNNSIAGIAEVAGNCTATVEITSAQSNIVTIANPTDLDLNDSLTIAHDNGGLTLFSEAPATFEKRINQTWRLDEDNEVGNITISFDLSTTTISTTSSDFGLIIDTNTNFTDATVHTTGLSISGRTVTFTNVNFTHAEYFTLAVTENFNQPTDLTNLRAWYDATDNTTLYTDESCATQVSTTGQDVRCWQDKSNYSANATNVSGKGMPTFITNEFNGLSVLNFSKSETDTLRHVVPAQYTANFTIFLVIQSKGNAATYDSFFSNGEPADSTHFQIDYTNDSGQNSFRYGASTKFLFENYSNEIRLYSVTHNSTFTRLYNEGNEVNNGSTTEGRVFEHYRINQNRNGNQHHNSKIAEIILYDRVLTNCELEKVNIYLGTKYGRDFFGVSDNYGYGSPHDNDINGIGEFNSTCTTTKEFTRAQSDMATIFSASSLDLGDALTFAHDNLGSGLSTNAPASYGTRINQSWRVDEDNEPGNISISFDLSGTGISTVRSNDFALLIDNDTNFSDATVHTLGLSSSGNRINVTTVNLSDGEYFTLAVSEKTPNIDFVNPTPANATTYGQSSFTINITSNASNDDHYTFVNFDNSLLMWLRMDDTNSSGDPTDASGNGNNGSLEGNAFINGTGKFGDAAHFDGNGDFINLPASNALIENQAAWTMSLWFNTRSIASASLGNRIITLRNASGLSAMAFTLGHNNQLQFFYRNQGGTGITTNITSVATGAWYHYAVTYNGSASKIYINGTLNATILDTIVGTSSDTARIGANPTGSSQFFNGTIDEVLILNHEITADEIASLYNASANQYLTNTTALSDGNHNFTGYAVGINGQKNQTETRTVTIDTTPPVVTALVPASETAFNESATIEVAANATDLTTSIDTVRANITYPNSTVVTITLTNAIGDKYNTSFTLASGSGTYNITFIANDTAGNINNTEETTFTALINRSPEIAFVNQTPLNATIRAQNNIPINITSNAFGDDHYTFLDFNNSVVLWMRMDDINASGDPTDISKNQNNGTLIGNALINVTGKFGSALHLDGNGDNIIIPDDTTLRFGTGDFSYSVWFKVNEIPTSTEQILCKRTNGNGNYEVQIESGGRIRSWIGNDGGGSAFIDSSTTIVAGNWYHVVITRSEGTMYMYVNTNLENQTASTHNVTSTSSLYIGRDAPSASEFFNGSIDEVIIFNRSLNASEIASLYNASSNQYFNNFTQLGDGNYTVTGHAVGINGKRNQTKTRIVTIDTIGPRVTSLNATPNNTYNLTVEINITANITDTATVDTVRANITYPNNTITQITLSQGIGNTYNNTFTAPNLAGTYTVRIIANDTVSNINSSETTTFVIVNDPPNPSSTQIHAGNDITLTSGTNTTIIGNATVTDLNGYNDITSVTGYLFLTTTGVDAADNRTTHYTSACTDNGDGSGNTVTYNCTFNVSHYATPTDAGSNQSATNWTFQISPLDAQSEGTNATDVVELNTLLSFTINPSTIDFGALNLGENTTNTNQEINVTNRGNVGLDILLSGTNFSCTPGIIPVNFLEYEDNPFSYGVGTDLLETGVELDLDARVGYEGNETPLRITYYGLGSPGSSVGGSCSGTITITGQGDPHTD